MTEPTEPMDWDTFEATYGEIATDADGSVIQGWDQVAGNPIERIWTVVECDDDMLIAIAGAHLVNRLGYLLTEKPWITGDEEAIYDDGIRDD